MCPPSEEPEKRATTTLPPGSGTVPAGMEDGDRLRVLDHVNEGIAVVHADNFLYVNEPLFAMLGYPSREALVAIHKVSEIAGMPSFDAWVESSVGIGSEQSWRRADGERMRVDVSVSTMSIGGQSVRVVLVRDVTAAWRAQAQLRQTERLAAVGTLATGVAHQLNNPLAYVIANMNFLADELPEFLQAMTPGELSAEERARLDDLLSAMSDAREGAERVARIVRDLRTFSRMEDERRELLDVHALLDSACVLVDNELKSRGRLVKVYEQVSPVEANPSRLAQVFLNLVLNAVQAIPEGATSRNEVTVHTFNDDRDGMVVVEIRDTGVGMSPAVQARIFDPFYTRKPVGEGTGLGLTTCLTIVQALGGRISVESAEGRGSTFRVRIPAASTTSHQQEVTRRPPAHHGKPARILIVDDEPTLLSSLKRALAREMDVVLAERAEDAIAILDKDQSFEVILCDIMMPDVTGIDLFAHINETHPHLAERFIFMTGGAFSPSIRQFLDGTKLPRLEKPFDIRELRRLVQQRTQAESGSAR